MFSYRKITFSMSMARYLRFGTGQRIARGVGFGSRGIFYDHCLKYYFFRFKNDHQLDENHTVVATARGSFDHQGGVLESPETGVSIVIPAGAIPEGVQQEIYFKVCRDNNILPPLDKEKGR